MIEIEIISKYRKIFKLIYKYWVFGNIKNKKLKVIVGCGL